MGKATTKSGNLQRALEARRRANAEREARERAIVQSLKEFLDELDGRGERAVLEVRRQ